MIHKACVRYSEHLVPGEIPFVCDIESCMKCVVLRSVILENSATQYLPFGNDDITALISPEHADQTDQSISRYSNERN